MTYVFIFECFEINPDRTVIVTPAAITPEWFCDHAEIISQFLVNTNVINPQKINKIINPSQFALIQ